MRCHCCWRCSPRRCSPLGPPTARSGWPSLTATNNHPKWTLSKGQARAKTLPIGTRTITPTAISLGRQTTANPIRTARTAPPSPMPSRVNRSRAATMKKRDNQRTPAKTPTMHTDATIRATQTTPTCMESMATKNRAPKRRMPGMMTTPTITASPNPIGMTSKTMATPTRATNTARM